jgi:hypothetical protein
MLTPRQKFVKNLTLPLALLIFVALFAVDFLMVPLADSSTIKFMRPGDARISDDFGPRIDSEAAMVEKVDGKIIPVCKTFPNELWILLLASYVFLLLFNLFYDFQHSQKIHWFWESLYTVLALWAWYAYDTCRLNLWFPLYVIKLGLIAYLIYLYIFYKKKELETL